MTIQQAAEAGRRIALDAIADGHPETPNACLEFWLGLEEWEGGPPDPTSMSRADWNAIEDAFLAAAESAWIDELCDRRGYSVLRGCKMDD